MSLVDLPSELLTNIFDMSIKSKIKELENNFNKIYKKIEFDFFLSQSNLFTDIIYEILFSSIYDMINIEDITTIYETYKINEINIKNINEKYINKLYLIDKKINDDINISLDEFINNIKILFINEFNRRLLISLDIIKKNKKYIKKYSNKIHNSYHNDNIDIIEYLCNIDEYVKSISNEIYNISMDL